MISFDFINGVARKDSLIAVIIYHPDDFKEIFGNASYKDYLLQTHLVINGLIESEPVRVVKVPFSKTDYSKWLARNKYWEEGPEARTAWALDKAVKISKKKEYVLVPEPPLGELISGITLLGVAPVSVMDDSELKSLYSEFSDDLVTNIASELVNFFPGMKKFSKLSRYRCEGIHVCPYNRLVPLDVKEAVEPNMGVLLDFEEGDTMRFVIPEFDLSIEEGLSINIAMLPVLLIGPKTEMDFCRAYMRENFYDIPAVTRLIRDAANERLLYSKLSGDLMIMPYEEFNDDMIEICIDNTDCKFKSKKKTNHLRRVK
ncbi:hypothetical protein ACOBQJ_03055 [Pelotomaculum propionicicum]|uniref:hypothetical protein n=1 Tax=Pelotomaculum propionicicum TaxID=258475 RepID=UPI003B7BAAB6